MTQSGPQLRRSFNLRPKQPTMPVSLRESDYRKGRLPSCMAGTSGDAGDGSERSPYDVAIYPNAKNRPAVRQPGFDIRRCLRIGAGTERVLVIGEQCEIGDAGAP